MKTYNKEGPIKPQFHKPTSEWPKKTKNLPFSI